MPLSNARSSILVQWNRDYRSLWSGWRWPQCQRISPPGQDFAWHSRWTQVIGFICTQPQDLISFDIGVGEAFHAFLVGRYYEAIADRRWPVCTEGIAVDIGGVCASIQDFLGPHLERYNQAGAGANPVGIAQRNAANRRSCIWSAEAGGDQTDTSRGSLRLSLNGLEISLSDWINILEMHTMKGTCHLLLIWTPWMHINSRCRLSLQMDLVISLTWRANDKLGGGWVPTS